MNLLEIKQQLNDQFKGKTYSSSYTYSGINAYSIGLAAVKILADAGINKGDLLVYDNKNISCEIKYKKHTLFTVVVKKAKGGSHYKYGNTWCDWSVKAIEIVPGYFQIDNELTDATAAIEEQVAREQASANKKDERAASILKYIMDTYGISSYDAGWVCDYIAKNRYKLCDMIANK